MVRTVVLVRRGNVLFAMVGLHLSVAVPFEAHLVFFDRFIGAWLIEHILVLG